MVLPDGTGSHPGKPQTGRMIWVALAGVVLIGGFIGLSTLSASDPEAAGSTSTSSTTPRSTTSTLDLSLFSVGDIAQGDPLHWGQVMAIDESYPTALVEHDGSWMLFSNEGDGGLLAWRSANGVDWEPLGQVIAPEHAIAAGVSTVGDALVAMTNDETGSRPILWRSVNGADWSMDQIELESDDGPTGLFPNAIGGNGETYLIFGSRGSGHDPVYDRLKAAVGDLVDLDDYGWDHQVVGEEITATVYGPLGIAIVTYSAEELDLTALEREQIIESYSGSAQPPLMWRSTDGVIWEETAIDGVEWIDSITSTPDGRLLVFGYGPNGPRIHTSSDGLVWEPSLQIVQPYSVQTWGDVLIGAGGGMKPSVMVSADANLWESVGPGAVFPDPIPWNIEALGSGPGGIAAQVTGYPPDEPPEPLEPVVLVAGNGAELSLDFNGVIRLTSPDGQDHVWSVTGLTPDDAHADLATGEMVFTDQTTGEEVARFSLEDLRDAESEYWASQSAPRSFDAFVFTPDASTWTIQDFEDVAADSYLTMLDVTDSHVIAVRVADDFDPDSKGGFEVWAAEVP